jgi:hypothetical protein
MFKGIEQEQRGLGSGAEGAKDAVKTDAGGPSGYCAHCVIYAKVYDKAGKLGVQIRATFEVETPASQPIAFQREAK